MSRILLILTIHLWTQNIFSQNIWFHDDFKDNRNGWETYSEEFLKVGVKDSNYCITKESSDFWYTQKSIFIDPLKDLEIRFEIKNSGSPKTEHGLVWNIADADNYYCLTINNAGNVFIRKMEAQKPIYLFKGTHPKIKDQRKYNTLKMVKRKDSLYFAIADSFFFRTLYSAMPISKMNIGFGLFGNGKIQVNYITILQDNKIHNVDSVSKGLVKRNMGANINTKFMEAVPIISADGKNLFWAVKGDPKNTKSPEKYDIWYSTSIGDTAWTKRKNLGAPVNNEGHNWLISMSPDNNMMILANLYNDDGSYKEGIGISQCMRSKTGWAVPKHLRINNFENLSKFAQYCLSPDQRVLVMAIEMSDSKGGQDLYVSFLQDDGSFSEPKNMGNINSIGKECTPFIAADGTTLYFSTNGRPGYGDNDIFVASRKDNSWTNWSEPANLGPEVNTPNFDADYCVPASGKFALMVSKDHSLGGSDIFRIDLTRQAGKPKPVILLKGRVLNDVTKQPIEAKISYNDLLTDQEVGIATSSPVDGSYNIVLPPGTDYSLMARKEGFISESDHIYAIEITEYTEMPRDLHLIPLEIGVSVQLKNLFFETGKGLLMEESNAELYRLVKLLKDNPEIEIEIAGYTDNQGAAESNLKLSQDRADAIRKFLVSAGIEPNRVAAKGYGKANAIASNDTEEGRAQNRRVEFKVVKK